MKIPDAIASLAALAQETRLAAVRLLVQAGPGGLPAGELGAALGVPAATLSFHLKELRGAGLVRCERAGRSRIYRPDFAAANALLAFLSENCCRGAACAPQRADAAPNPRPGHETGAATSAVSREERS